MQRALPLVASLFSVCPGASDPLSRPVADRPHPDTFWATSLPPARVPSGSALQQRPTPADPTESVPRFSRRRGQERGIWLTTHHGYGRSRKETGPHERHAGP
jgi:hypothetical protein